MRARNDLTASYVRRILNYDPRTGILRWKQAVARRVKIGQIAGWVDRPKGHVKISIKHKNYLAHRIIWLWMTGRWPLNEIDHENNRRADNRWTNLREATTSQNCQNRKRSAANTSGYKGACYVRGKWHAQIKINGITKHLGVFDSPLAARRVYCAKARQLFGPFYNRH
jgi:hypothetical protein